MVLGSFERRVLGASAWLRIEVGMLEAPHTGANTGRLKVEQNTDRRTCQLQVGDHLSQMDGVQAIDRLNLHNDQAVDHDVDAQIVADSMAAVVDGNVLLDTDFEPSQAKFDDKCIAVHGLKKSRSEGLVDLDGAADDSLSEIPVGAGHVLTTSRKRANRNCLTF